MQVLNRYLEVSLSGQICIFLQMLYNDDLIIMTNKKDNKELVMINKEKWHIRFHTLMAKQYALFMQYLQTLCNTYKQFAVLTNNLLCSQTICQVGTCSLVHKVLPSSSRICRAQRHWFRSVHHVRLQTKQTSIRYLLPTQLSTLENSQQRIFIFQNF